MNKMPVILTFDVDGEMIWRNRDPENANRPVTLSMGQYGITSGLPRVLKLLKKYHLPATFFVPGMTAQVYPETIMMIEQAGCHEIGHHSYSHKFPDLFPSKEAEEEDYQKASGIIEAMTKKKLAGYRSPAWEFSAHTLDILEAMGITYSSNMMGTDRIEYLKVFDRQSKIVELPVHWILDDAAFWLYSVRIAGKAMQPLESVQKCWMEEFDGLYEEFMEEEENGVSSDITYVLTCHPQIIGRPSRLKVLERVIKHINAHPNVAFLTGIEAAEQFKKRQGNLK